MKKILSASIIIIISGVLFSKYHFPYWYIPVPKYWSMSEIGLPEIKEPSDFRLYYIDVIQAPGHDSKELRYSAIYQAYRNSEKESYIHIASLINLTGNYGDIDDQMYMQKTVLKKYLTFENRCYNYQCRSGHHIAGVALEYAKNLAKSGDMDGASKILQDTYSSREDDFKAWVKFSILENMYFILVKKNIGLHELKFFTTAIDAVNVDSSNSKLVNRYGNLLKWNNELKVRYSEQTLK